MHTMKHGVAGNVIGHVGPEITVNVTNFMITIGPISIVDAIKSALANLVAIGKWFLRLIHRWD